MTDEPIKTTINIVRPQTAGERFSAGFNVTLGAITAVGLVLAAAKVARVAWDIIADLL